MDAIAHIRDHLEVESVLFLTPCHGTPFYSQVHRDIPMMMLDCSPPMDNAPTSWRTQQDEFFEDPHAFLSDWFRAHAQLPTHVVIFQPALERARSVLLHKGYVECVKFFHTFEWMNEDDRAGELHIYGQRCLP